MQQNSNQSKREQGFAHIGLILAVAVLMAALAFGGWWVWQKNRDNKQASKTNQNQASQSDSQQTTDPSEGGKYLVITEWGVRFLLPEELRGDVLTYVSTTNVSGTVLFASKELNNLTGDDTCNLIKQPSGSYSGGIQASLVRINPLTYPADVLESYKQQLVGPIKKIGDYDYYSRKQTKSPPITCLTGQHEEFNDVEQSISSQLREAFKTIETIE